MSIGYHHTDESARDTLREYRDTNGYDTFAEAIDSMRECIDDLDDEERSALLHLESTSALIYDLYFTPRKVIKRWCIAIQWSDGTSEERTDVPDLRDLEDCMDEWEEEANK